MAIRNGAFPYCDLARRRTHALGSQYDVRSCCNPQSMGVLDKSTLEFAKDLVTLLITYWRLLIELERSKKVLSFCN